MWFLVLFMICGLALVFVGFDGAGAGGGSASGLSGSAAKVGSHTISAGDLSQRINSSIEQYSRLFPNQDSSNNFVRQLSDPDRILDSMISDKSQLLFAESSGFKVSNEAIREFISKQEAFQTDGKFDPLKYRERLTQPGLYEERIREHLQRTSFIQELSPLLSIQSKNEEAAQKVLSQKKYFETLKIDSATFEKNIPEATSDEVAAYLSDAKNKSKVATRYEADASKYVKKEEIRANHILIRESEGGLEKIKEVQEEIKSGKISFSEAAKKYSSDKSNSEKGGDLNFFPRGVMDKSFEATAFNLKNTGDISEPVKSSFGFHLIELTDRKAASTTPLKDVENTIAAQMLKKDKAQEKLNDVTAKWTQTAPSASELSQYGAQWTALSPWSANAGNLQGFSEEDFDYGTLFKLKTNEIYPKAIQQGSSYAFVRAVAQPANSGSEDATKNLALNGTAAPDNATASIQSILDAFKTSLEKSNKIKKSNKVLNTIRRQFAELNR